MISFLIRPVTSVLRYFTSILINNKYVKFAHPKEHLKSTILTLFCHSFIFKSQSKHQQNHYSLNLERGTQSTVCLPSCLVTLASHLVLSVSFRGRHFHSLSCSSLSLAIKGNIAQHQCVFPRFP